MPEKLLVDIYKEDPIPSTRNIAFPIIRERVDNLSEEEIKSLFDDLVPDLEGEIYSFYKTKEKQHVSKALKKYFLDLSNEQNISGKEELLGLMAGEVEALKSLYLSLSQSRRARAGSTFELIITQLIERLNYPYSVRPIINGSPDFLFPSKEYYQNFPADCLIFTAKRTLRERWRQITTEGTRGSTFFLATIDEDISSNQLREALNNRIYIVVPRRHINENYRRNRNVISFGQFFNHHLDPAMQRWRENGVI